MATDAQIAANRLNSLHSCGPKSPESKAKVSQNRTTHGLCGKFFVQHFEKQEQYDALVAGLMEAEEPANASEVELVVKMAEHTWLSRRALRMQEDSFEMGEVDEYEAAKGISRAGLDVQRLQVAMRYHTMHDRAYQRAAKELMERKKQRQLAEIGFERKKAAEAEAQRKSEKHQTAQEIANLKKQLLEIRVGKHYIAELRRIKPEGPSNEQEFQLTDFKSAA